MCSEKAAEDIGLSPDLAEKLSRQTIVGAAKLIEQSGLHPEELEKSGNFPKWNNPSGIGKLSPANLEIVIKAANAARERSIELSRT